MAEPSIKRANRTRKAKKRNKTAATFYDDVNITAEVRERFSRKQIDAYREAFLLFDKDGDGVITTAEVKTVLLSMGQDPTEKHVSSMMEAHDKDGSGSIDFPEFIKVVSQIQEDEHDEDELVDVFRVLDHDGDGFITKADLRHIVVMMDSTLSNNDIEEMIDVADKDGDGMIAFEEFVKIVMSRS